MDTVGKGHRTKRVWLDTLKIIDVNVMHVNIIAILLPVAKFTKLKDAFNYDTKVSLSSGILH